MRKPLHLVSMTLTLVGILAGAAAASDPPIRSSPSDATLDALVAGVALYPDETLHRILEASTQPILLHRAANREEAPVRRGRLARRVSVEVVPPAIQALASNPELLSLLDQHLALTARLGRAYESDPDGVWRAIERVRWEVTARADAYLWLQARDDSGGDAASEPTSAPPAAAFEDEDALLVAMLARATPRFYAPEAVAGLVDIAVDAEVAEIAPIEVEVDVDIDVTHDATVDGQIVTATGSTPAGTATGSGVVGAGTLTSGDTTVKAGGFAGTVTGPAGKTVNAAGAAIGSVTATEDGATFQSVAGGAVVNPETGAYAGGVRYGSGSASVNSDGSVDVDRSSGGALASSAGDATWQHDGEAHVTGDRGGSYSGSTTVDTTHGTVTSQTTVGDGQASTTIDSPQGGGTYTAGDNQVGGGGAWSSAAKKPQSSPSTPSAPVAQSRTTRQLNGPQSRTTQGQSRAGQGRSSHAGAPDAVQSSVWRKQADAGTAARGGASSVATGVTRSVTAQPAQANAALQKSWGELNARMSGPSAGSSAGRAPSPGRSAPKPSKSRGGRGHR